MPSDIKKSKSSRTLKTAPLYDQRILNSGLPPEPKRSSREPKEGQKPKDRQTPLADAPPPQQGQKNLYRKLTRSSVTEIFNKPLPRVDNTLPPVAAEAKDQYLPSSPDFQLPSEEIQRQRRLEKVRRMLGERIPAELIYRGGTKIINVNAFPDPPSPTQTDTLTQREQREKQPKQPLRIARRASFSPSSFPTLSSVSATLLPTGHASALGKSHILTHLNGPPTPTANSLLKEGLQEGRKTNSDVNAHPEPRMFSPFVFTKDVTLPRARTFHAIVSSNKSRPSTADGPSDAPLQRRKDVEKNSSPPRPSSLHTSTVIQPSSPTRDSQNDKPSVMEPTLEVDVDSHLSRPESTLLSPMEFTKPSFQLTVGDEDGVEDDSSSGSQTPPPRPRYRKQSETVRGRTSSHTSNSDLHALFSRPDTPFVDSVESGLLAPQATVEGQGDPRDPVMRRERRQGWSGEWNRGDMQDVIKTLRTLK
jgi:hypothetical protein